MSELKSFLSPQSFNYPVNQRIETDILFPVSKSQSSVKFVFDKKGILDHNSKVRLKCLVPTQPAGGDPEGNNFFPIHTGVSAMVSRAWLEIGGRRVSMLEQVGNFNTLLNLSYTPEYKENILKVQEGVSDGIVGASNSTGTIDGLIGASNSNAEISRFIKLKSTTALSPEFSIPLSRLIPMLKFFQLPLFAIDQEVSLTIEFNKPLVQEMYCKKRTEIAVIPSVDVDNCILMADYLYYPDDMDDIAMKIASPTGYAHLFDELIVVEGTENAVRPTGPAIGAGLHIPASFTQQIALAGKTLKGIAVQTFKVGNGLEGNYVSNDDQIEDQYNFTINSKPFYAQDVYNASFKYNEVNKIFGRNLSLNNWEYSFLNQVTDVAGNAGGTFVAGQSAFSDWTIENYTNQVRTASQRWLGLQLANDKMGVGGLVMSNLPIIFRRNRQIMNDPVFPGANEDYQTSVAVRFYCITGMVLMLKNGMATIIQ